MRILLFLFALGMFMPALAANRLATAGSPYLRTHAENPVDWYPWGDEAFEKAKREGKPVFLSIGYSSCYWCRVAEETLYRNPKIAAQMNAGFVNVKVDREQRPDLDRLYSIANQELGGSGGWPNNLFLTPERKPFYAGSYFPPEDDDLGRTGFPNILARIDTAWKSRRHEVEALAERVATAMRQRTLPAVSVEPAIWRRQAAATLMAREDRAHGGLENDSTAKFPQVPELTLLAAHAEGRFVVRRAMEAMARSALYDHLGGGFHRYTIDEPWNQPHFEKMLYDNAQLLRLYAVEGRGPLQRAAALATAEFMLTRMQAPEGGFYGSFDAVSDGREGAHYLWDAEEIRAVLGPAAAGFLAAYRIVPMPDHPGEAFENIGRERGTLRMGDAAWKRSFTNERKRLLQHRDRRPFPARDDKIILGWNGLAIEALAVAGKKLAAPRLTQAARKAADRLWRDAWEPAPGRLRQAIFEGRAQGEGFLEDYALFGLGLLAVGQRERAARLADAMLVRFGRADGGLAETIHAAELFVPVPETGDGFYPSGASAAYRLLSRLAKDDPRFIAPADKLLAALAPLIARAPDRWPSLLDVLPDQTGMAKRDSGVDPAAGSAGVVSAIGRWQGGNRLVVSLHIAPGWHVNANPASFDYLIPTQLGFTGAQPRSVRYPGAERFRATFTKSDITVYSGAVTIEAEFTAKRPTATRLTVQACSAEVCLPPADLVLSPR